MPIFAQLPAPIRSVAGGHDVGDVAWDEHPARHQQRDYRLTARAGSIEWISNATSVALSITAEIVLAQNNSSRLSIGT